LGAGSKAALREHNNLQKFDTVQSNCTALKHVYLFSEKMYTPVMANIECQNVSDSPDLGHKNNEYSQIYI